MLDFPHPFYDMIWGLLCSVFTRGNLLVFFLYEGFVVSFVGGRVLLDIFLFCQDLHGVRIATGVGRGESINEMQLSYPRFLRFSSTCGISKSSTLHAVIK